MSKMLLYRVESAIHDHMLSGLVRPYTLAGRREDVGDALSIKNFCEQNLFCSDLRSQQTLCCCQLGKGSDSFAAQRRSLCYGKVMTVAVLILHPDLTLSLLNRVVLVFRDLCAFSIRALVVSCVPCRRCPRGL